MYTMIDFGYLKGEPFSSMRVGITLMLGAMFSAWPLGWECRQGGRSRGDHWLLNLSWHLATLHSHSSAKLATTFTSRWWWWCTSGGAGAPVVGLVLEETSAPLHLAHCAPHLEKETSVLVV